MFVHILGPQTQTKLYCSHGYTLFDAIIHLSIMDELHLMRLVALSKGLKITEG